MYGKLNDERIEALLETEELIGDPRIPGAIVDIQEAACQFPAEDFLSEQIESLQELAKKLRGDNKERLLHIIECLDDVAQCVSNASDFGHEHLSKAETALERLT